VSIIWILLRDSWLVGARDACDALGLAEHTAEHGLETPLLSGRQFGGDLECRQIVEGAPDPVQIRFELRGSRRQRRLGCFVAAQILEWCA